MARPFQAVTLDLFGTLVDFDIERDETPLVAELLGGTGSTPSPRRVLAAWLHESLDERAREPFRTVTVALARGAARAARKLGLDDRIDPPAWAAALEALWASRPLYGDVGSALDGLDDAGVPFAVVTNLDRHVLDDVFARTGLDARVGTVVCSEQARAYKPHPRPWRLALARLGIRAADAMHIGDSAREDRAGARAAGLDARLVDRPRADLMTVVEACLDEAGPVGGT